MGVNANITSLFIGLNNSAPARCVEVLKFWLVYVCSMLFVSMVIVFICCTVDDMFCSHKAFFISLARIIFVTIISSKIYLAFMLLYSLSSLMLLSNLLLLLLSMQLLVLGILVVPLWIFCYGYHRQYCR